MPNTNTVVAPASESAFALNLDGRIYGGTSANPFEKLRHMPVPKELEALVDALHQRSKLLALSTDATDDAVFDAYGADLTLMHRYRSAFKTTLEAAVRSRADEKHTDAQASLADLA